jgi:hypothetical protein
MITISFHPKEPDGSVHPLTPDFGLEFANDHEKVT